MRGLFITGTDTSVGKTHIACQIVRELRAAGRRVGAFKPACSGAWIDVDSRSHWDDVEQLRAALGRNVSDDRLCPQRFRAALAPPVSARREGRSVDLELIQRTFATWKTRCDLLVVEGAGGLLCPLTDNLTIADWAAQIGFPLIIVTRLGLGTINHTLLTVEAAKHRGLPIAGILFNETQPTTADLSPATNANEVAARCDVPVLAIRRHDSAVWLSRFGQETQLDWWALAGVP